MNNGVELAWGAGVAGWRETKGGNWDNCNSISNKIFKKKENMRGRAQKYVQYKVIIIKVNGLEHQSKGRTFQGVGVGLKKRKKSRTFQNVHLKRSNTK